MTTDQREIEELLGRRIGLDPGATGPHVILAAARRRMAELGVVGLAEYAARAAGSEAEQQALIEEVVVPESWFFRDERPFRRLSEYARQRWVAMPSRPPFRALSIPCAGGQEPYSIAIALLDAGLSSRRFRIDAVDISARSLEVARRGVYSANALRGLEAADRDGRWAKHFRRHAHSYEVDPAIRATVHFQQGNILDPTLLADAPPHDVVFCRNLLIYLDAGARARVLSAIDRLLADDGLLFIGHADRLEPPDRPGRFATAGEPGTFAYRKATAQPALPPPEPFPPMLMPPEPLPSWVPTPEATTATPAPVEAVARPPSLLDQAAELANQERYGEAIAACERHLLTRGPAASVYHLLGMIRQASGDRRGAEECFHKTIYLDPRHDEALLSLALLAERRGDRDAAAGFRRRALRAGRGS